MKRVVTWMLVLLMLPALLSACTINIKAPGGGKVEPFTGIETEQDGIAAIKQTPKDQQKNAMLCACFYLVGETGSVETTEYAYEGELTVEGLAAGLSEWIGLDFAVRSYADGGVVIVDWSKDSALFGGADQRGSNAKFTFNNAQARAWFMLDSLSRTIMENLGAKEVFYTMDGGKTLAIEHLSYPAIFPADIPYLGSVYYEKHSAAVGIEAPDGASTEASDDWFMPGCMDLYIDGNQISVKQCEDTGAGVCLFTLKGYMDSEGYYPYHAEELTVTDPRSGALITSFEVDTICNLDNLGLNIVDLNFDGVKDIMLFGDIGGAHENITYLAYLWDAAEESFIFDGSFSEIVNATVDETRQIILEITSDSFDTMWYAMYRYADGTFVREAGLYVENDPAEPDIVFTEYSYPEGVETVVESIRGKIVNSVMPGGASKYYQDGSYWDIDNPVWRAGDHYRNGGDWYD